MDLWSGNIKLDNGSKVEDINIFSQSAGDAAGLIPSTSSLEFLAVVQVSELPLSLVAGPSHTVWTQTKETQEWFSEVLLQEPTHGNAAPTTSWFDWSRESYAGVLTRVLVDHEVEKGRVATELMFYGVMNDGTGQNPEDSTLQVRVLPLSSTQIDGLGGNESPPISRDASPHKEDKTVIQGRFIHQVPVSKAQQSRKRPTTSDIFDAADELRRRIRGNGGAGISQVAALSQARPTSLQTLSRNGNNADGKKRVQPVGKPLSAVTFSTQFSTLNSRKSLMRTPSLSVTSKSQEVFGIDRRRIERTHSLPIGPAHSSLEQLNRDAISNLVLKGMRVYGFQPKKRPEKEVESPPLDQTSQAHPSEEEEYKLVYHQTFKAAVFAFRKTISGSALYQHGDVLRDTVDNLLSIFCTAPILND